MKRTESLSEFLASYKNRLSKLIDKIEVSELESVISAIVTAFKNGNTLYLAGNGGSAATASHMQADFQFFVRYFTDFHPIVLALTDNVPMITAVGNDTDFNDIFVEQLKGKLKKGDVLLVISASGNSENVVRAVKYANEIGAKTIAFIGFKGGRLKDMATIPLFTPNDEKDYGPIEDLHMILDHIIVNYLSKDEEFLAIK